MSKPQTLLFEQAIRSHLLEQEKKTQFLSETYQAMRETTDKFVTEEALLKIVRSCMLTEANEEGTALTQSGAGTKPDQNSKLQQTGAMATKAGEILLKVAKYISDLLVSTAKKRILKLIDDEQDKIADMLIDISPNKLRLDDQMIKAGLEKYVKTTLLLISEGKWDSKDGGISLSTIMKGVLFGGGIVGGLATGGASTAIGAAAKAVLLRMFGDKAFPIIKQAITDIIKVAATGDKSGTKYGKWPFFNTIVSFFNKRITLFVNNTMFPYMKEKDPGWFKLQAKYDKARGNKGLEAQASQDPFGPDYDASEWDDPEPSPIRRITRENKKRELQEQKVYNRWQLIAGIK